MRLGFTPWLAFAATILVSATSLSASATTYTSTPVPSPAPKPDIAENQSSSAVGAIPGAFAVSGSGSATYRIPIELVPGTAGKQPSVELQYNSGGSNGILGQGWSLSGVSPLTRCRKTLQIDGEAGPIDWSENDRLCFEGQRLILVEGEYWMPGSVYRKEIDDQTRVYRPSIYDWEVRRKDATVAYYNHFMWHFYAYRHRYGVHSGQYTNWKNVYQWWPIRVTDPAGGVFSYKYSRAAGHYAIGAITYAHGGAVNGSNTAQVYFEYEDRPDNGGTSAGGVSFPQSKRVHRIRSRQYQGLYHETAYYQLAYDDSGIGSTSRLTSIHRCDYYASWTCQAPTSFTWTERATRYEQPSDHSNAESIATDKRATRIADLNGDGRDDLVWVSNGQVRFFLSDGEKLVEPVAAYADMPATGDEWQGWQVLDYNSDTFHDVLAIRNEAGQDQWVVYFGSADGLDGSYHATGIAASTHEHALAIDLNADGLADLFTYTPPPTGSVVSGPQTYTVRLSERVSGPLPFAFGGATAASYSANLDLGTGPAGHIPVIWGSAHSSNADFDGDGRVDLLLKRAWCAANTACTGQHRVQSEWLALVNSVAGDFTLFDQTSIPDSHLDEAQAIIGDFNRDGFSDVVNSGEDGFYLYKVDDGAFTTGERYFDPYFPAKSGMPIGFIDILQNGVIDLPMRKSLRYNRKWLGYLYAAHNNTYLAYGEDDLYFTMDLSGDGLDETVRLYQSGGQQQQVRFSKESNFPGEKVTQIDNGMGRVVDIEYASLLDESVYSKDSDASEEFWPSKPGVQRINGGAKLHPVFDIYAPVYVVKSTTTSNPAGSLLNPGAIDTTSVRRMAYQYAGAKIEGGGMGFLGFRAMAAIDKDSSADGSVLHTITQYRQDYPFQGRLDAIETYRTSAATISCLDNTPACSLLSRRSVSWSAYDWASVSTYAPGTTYKVYAKSESSTSYDLGSGQPLQHSETTREIDAWGNVVAETSSVFDAPGGNLVSSESTTNVYADAALDAFEADYSARYGKASLSTVTLSRPGHTPTTRTTSTSHHASGKALGLPQSVTVDGGVPAGALTTSYNYNDMGNVIETSLSGAAGKAGANPQTRTTEYGWDAIGQVRERTTRRFGTTDVDVERVTGYTNGRPSSFIIDPFGTTKEVQYDAFGQPYFEYTSTGASTTVTKHLGAEGLCPISTEMYTITSANSGGESLACIDSDGREVRQGSRGFDGTWTFVDTEYDAGGRVLRASEPYLDGAVAYWTEYSYDGIGRVIAIDHPHTAADTTVIYTADSSIPGAVIKIVTTNPKGQRKTEYKNSLGEIVKVVDAIGGTITYGYDSAGNLISTNANGSVTTIAYDNLGRKVAMNDPDKGAWSYAYNAFGELVEQTDALGQVSAMSYDEHGRMVSRTDQFASGGIANATTWTYDTQADGAFKPGLLTQVDHTTYEGMGGNFIQSYFYDAYGREARRETLIDAGPAYTSRLTYDAYGRVFQQFDITGDEAGIEYGYNSYGHLETISESAIFDGVAGPTYYRVQEMDARGNTTLALLGNGTTVVRGYEAASGFLTHMLADDGLMTVQDLTLSYDELGNVMNRTDIAWGEPGYAQKNIQESFTYDELNRLTSSRVDDVTHTVAYDMNGNITNKSGVGTYTYGLNAGPHAVTEINDGTSTAAYSYDANGNQISGGGRTLSYTTFDKPHTISKGTHLEHFVYGPDRLRFRRQSNSKSTTYLGSVEINQEGEGTPVFTRQIAGHAIVKVSRQGGVRSPISTHYTVKDHLGSTDIIQDDTGQVVHDLSFDAWGQRRVAQDWQAIINDPISIAALLAITPRGYTEHEMLDEVGLIHMNGRTYDPKISRFQQGDIVVQSPTLSQNYNRYSYVINNPLQLIDPEGYRYRSSRKLRDGRHGWSVFIDVAYAASAAGDERRSETVEAGLPAFTHSGGMATPAPPGAAGGALSNGAPEVDPTFLGGVRQHFADLQIYNDHLRALNGDFGPDAQLKAEFDSALLTEALQIIFTNPPIEIDGEEFGATEVAFSKALDSVVENPAYFLGRTTANSLTAFSSSLPGYLLGPRQGAAATVAIGGYTWVSANLGAAVRIIQDGEEDLVNILSTAFSGVADEE